MNLKNITLRLHGEDGQIWNYVLSIILGFIVVGIIITQLFPIVMNHITIHGIADDALEEAMVTYEQQRGNMEEVNAAVQKVMSDKEARLEGNVTVVKGAGGEPDKLALSVRKIRNTYMFENIGYLCRYTEASTYSERPLP